VVRRGRQLCWPSGLSLVVLMNVQQPGESRHNAIRLQA
jgi:hypothetical protein